jgi:hypothetical protein
MSNLNFILSNDNAVFFCFSEIFESLQSWKPELARVVDGHGRTPFTMRH